MIEHRWDGIPACCKPETTLPLGFVEGIHHKIRESSGESTADTTRSTSAESPHHHASAALNRKIARKLPTRIREDPKKVSEGWSRFV